MADFFWCLMAAQRGYRFEDIADRLLEVRAKPRSVRVFTMKAMRLSQTRNAAAVAERARKRGRAYDSAVAEFKKEIPNEAVICRGDARFWIPADGSNPDLHWQATP
jgi:hypothetical protein